jgi:hypothetical protein
MAMDVSVRESDVRIFELKGVTMLDITAPGGEQARAWFYQEPDAPHVAQAQASWKAFRRMSLSLGQYEERPCELCSILKKAAFVAAVALGLALQGGTLAALACAGILVVWLLLVFVERFRTKSERELRDIRRREMDAVRARLYSYELRNDFEGALKFGLEVCGILPRTVEA